MSNMLRCPTCLAKTPCLSAPFCWMDRAQSLCPSTFWKTSWLLPSSAGDGQICPTCPGAALCADISIWLIWALIPRNSRTGSYGKIMKKSEDYFQRPINTLCSSGGILKCSAFEGSDEKESGLKAIQQSLPKGAEEDDHPSGAVGPAVPSSPGTGGATQAPHCTSRGMGWVAIDLCQRYDLQQPVPLWMVDYLFPFSFYQFSSVQLLSHVWPFRTHELQYPRLPCPSPTPRACSNSCLSSRWYHPAISSSVAPFSSCLQSFRVFSNASVLYIRWPKYSSFSFSISPSKKYSGLISFRIDWLDLLVVQGILKSLLQHHSSKASIFCSEEVQFTYFVFCCWCFWHQV